MRVVVIGAGIVGAATAIELQRDGNEVTLVDPFTPGGEQAASFGNGAWISPSSVVPMSMPGLWKKIPGFLRDPLGPLTIRWSALPALLPWLLRFLQAGATVARVEATARLLSSLLADAPARHRRLADEAGIPELIVQNGLLYAYPDRAAFSAEALAWRLRHDNGVRWTELEGPALRHFAPSLAPHYGFGVHVESGAHCTDPGLYVASLVRHALESGAQLVRSQATGFVIHGGRLHGVQTAAGVIACERAVVAAGVHSTPLARQAGDRVSLASERGYHVQVSQPGVAPLVPVMPSDGKMANTLTDGGLRAAGQVELAGIAAKPNWRRAEVLLAHLQRSYPDLPNPMPPERVTRWMGHRPSTPDGIPVLGVASTSSDIVYAFGHGHVGLATGPISGCIAADLVAGRAPAVAVEPFSATRFTRMLYRSRPRSRISSRS
jgi:D-amino-acid dehydrogenase